MWSIVYFPKTTYDTQMHPLTLSNNISKKDWSHTLSQVFIKGFPEILRYFLTADWFNNLIKFVLKICSKLTGEDPSQKFVFYFFVNQFHCVKNVQTPSFFWPVFSCIQSEYRKTWARIKLRIWTLFTQCS